MGLSWLLSLCSLSLLLLLRLLSLLLSLLLSSLLLLLLWLLLLLLLRFNGPLVKRMAIYGRTNFACRRCCPSIMTSGSLRASVSDPCRQLPEGFGLAPGAIFALCKK